MEQECVAHLRNVIIPYWKKLIDKDNGGFYGWVDSNLVVDPKADKGVILNSRILWFFSKAAFTLEDDGLLPYAKQAYDFLRNSCLDRTNGGLYHMISYDGKASNTEKYTYNQSFAIYALCAYFEATGNRDALSLAMEIFECIESHAADTYGYRESFSADWQPIVNDELSENGLIAEKTMNTLLHLLEAYTELLRCTKDACVNEQLTRLLEIFAAKVYNPDRNRLEVFFDAKLDSISDLHSYGHDIEATWLLDRAADVVGDRELIAKTRAYTDRIAHNILTQIAIPRGEALCLPNECFNGVTDYTRVWWVQAEAMVGFINKYQQTGDSAYERAASGLWLYINDHLWDKRKGGEWFWSIDHNDCPIMAKPITEPWKCPYHNGRMCMEMKDRYEDIRG